MLCAIAVIRFAAIVSTATIIIIIIVSIAIGTAVLRTRHDLC